MFEDICNAIMRVIAIVAATILLVLLSIATVRYAKSETYTCVVHKGEWVWIRGGPNYEAPQIGQLRFGYEVEVDRFENGFAHILWKDTEGWVAAQFLELPIKETMYRIICEGPLAKRETPAGRLLCWIKPGSKISVLGWRYAPDGSMWAKVYRGGYVKAAFLGEL